MVKLAGVCSPDEALDASADEATLRDAAASEPDGSVRPTGPDASSERDAGHGGQDAGPICDAGSDAAACQPGCQPREEVCDGLDNDCDGVADNGVTIVLYRDADGDGHGDATDPGEEVCQGDLREGKVFSHDDCDDACATCHPGNPEESQCDGKDDDCDASIDDGLLNTYILDCDGDGYAPNPRVAEADLCAPPPRRSECVPSSWVTMVSAGVDCDDRSNLRRPGLEETCDLIDNDCDSVADNGVKTQYTLDCDGDRYVTTNAVKVLQCPFERRPAPSGCTTSGAGVEYNPIWRDASTIRRGNDCADADSQAYPESSAKSAEKVGGVTSERVAWDYDCDGVNERAPNGRQCTAADRSACVTGGAGHSACYRANPELQACASNLTYETCSACNVAEVGCRISTSTQQLPCR